MKFWAVIVHALVRECAGSGLDREIEAVKREWWNVVTENSWEYVPPQKRKKKEDPLLLKIQKKSE